MRMTNGEVEAFANFLLTFDLIGRESRLRTRFVKLLGERMQLIKDEHAELIRQFAKFDDEGEPLIVEIDGQKAYDVPDRATFQREYMLLLLEDFVIDETEERKELLLFIKDVILNSDKTFSGRQALEYDRYCDIVEEIKYE